MATFINLAVLAYTHVAASVAGWIVLAFLSGCNAELTAQTESWGKNSQLLVRSWGVTSENQLQSIAAMLQTRDGYLWIGTSKGVVRFDGVRFSAFAYATTPGKSLLDAKQASVTVEVLTPFYKSWWMKMLAVPGGFCDLHCGDAPPDCQLTQPLAPGLHSPVDYDPGRRAQAHCLRAARLARPAAGIDSNLGHSRGRGDLL